ncbi:phasin family protein [Brachyspira pulli]|uniref:phasin family protein n=1 Tax=Brachyspira pulli TaxID=310721 RepID=UPI0030040B8B
MGLSDDIKSGFYAGIGMMLKGKEKLEEAAREFIKDKNVSAEEGEKFVKDMVNKASETKEEVTQFIDDRIKQVIDKMGYVKKDEYDSMRKELDELKSSMKNDQQQQ